MAELERTYVIPLRKQVNKSPMYKRAKKAVNTVRIFLAKHMKSKDVKLGQQINLLLWERGIKNPPGKIKVTAVKDDKGIVKAELFGHKYIEKKKTEKVEKSKLEQLKEKIAGKSDEKAEHNKEAITHVPSEKEAKTHIAKDKSDLNAEAEKERKVSSGTQKLRNKN